MNRSITVFASFWSAIVFAAQIGLLAMAQGQPPDSDDPFPVAKSKKGLQVQMVEDALELGIHHAALNFNLGQLIRSEPTEDTVTWQSQGKPYYFNRRYLAHVDSQIKALSSSGVVVSLIVLNYEPTDPELRRILLHPNYSTDCPNHLSAFNTKSEEGRQWFRAALEFMAHRWSRADTAEGQVWNWIIGNEVNSHWWWCNMGNASMQEFADDYALALTIACQAIRSQEPAARVYVSLEHHWNTRYPAGDESQSFAARPFLEHLAEKTKSSECPWHVAFHPYPENLFEPRTWNDGSATGDWKGTPRITFRNIEQLVDFLKRPNMLLDGQVRRVLLSEQGFHTPDAPEGEEIQAAAYCYAWNQIKNLDGIDAFILHRHVDHAHEGGLLLGLWTNKPGSIATPDRKKKIWAVFQAAGTAKETAAFEFSKRIIHGNN